jgi:hypothetical protein
VSKGLKGMAEESRRPRYSLLRLEEEVVCEISPHKPRTRNTDY